MTAPKIWSRFSVSRKYTDLKFRIQETTKDNHEEVLNFMKNYYFGAETFSRAAGIFKSKDAIREMFDLFTMNNKDNITLTCHHEKDYLTANATTMIATCMISLEKASDEDKLPQIITKVKTPEVKQFLNIVRVMKDLSGGVKTLGVDKWYLLRGCVHPDYSSLGIGREFMKVGRAMCKEHGVPAATMRVTAIGSQKAAERDGWKTFYEIRFDELGRLCECEFVGAPPTCKEMVFFVDK